MMKENCFGDGSSNTKSPMLWVRWDGSLRGLQYFRGAVGHGL